MGMENKNDLQKNIYSIPCQYTNKTYLWTVIRKSSQSVQAIMHWKQTKLHN